MATVIIPANAPHCHGVPTDGRTCRPAYGECDHSWSAILREVEAAYRVDAAVADVIAVMRMRRAS
jgi:hypothetical protein